MPFDSILCVHTKCIYMWKLGEYRVEPGWVVLHGNFLQPAHYPTDVEINKIVRFPKSCLYISISNGRFLLLSKTQCSMQCTQQIRKKIPIKGRRKIIALQNRKKRQYTLACVWSKISGGQMCHKHFYPTINLCKWLETLATIASGRAHSANHCVLFHFAL